MARDGAARRRRSRALQLGEVREIFTQLCHALGAAHAANIVHRDLKPENVFLAESRRAGVPFTVKVLDYGIAKLVADVQTHHTSAMGTPLWMAPEQTEAGGNICPATDVWALGLIAFRMLTGCYYWRVANSGTSSAMALMREVVFEPLVSASARAAEYGRSVPHGFDEWFARCVARDIAARFPDARRAGDAIDAVLRGAPSMLSSTAGMPPIGATPAPTIDVAPPIPPGGTVVAPQNAPWQRASTTGGLAQPAQAAPYAPYTPYASPPMGEPVPRASSRGALIAAALLGALVVGGGVFVLLQSRDAPPSTSGSQPTAVKKEIASKPIVEQEPPSPTPEPTSAPLESPEPKPPGQPQAPLPPTPQLGSGKTGSTEVKVPTGETSTGAAGGASTVKDADVVIARNRWRFKACYTKALAIDPNDGGKVVVRAVVAPDGTVTSATASSTTASASLTQCIVSSFMAMKFSEPDGGGNATITTPVVLSAKK
jgi:serine/threonine protein kinase